MYNCLLTRLLQKNLTIKERLKIIPPATNVLQGVVNLSVINQKLIIMAQDQKKSDQKQDSAKKQDQKSDQKGKQQTKK